MDEADVVYVGGSGASDAGACGTIDSPCLTIQKGVDVTSATRNVVLVAAGTYDERVNITAGTMSLIAEGEVFLEPDLLVAGQSVATVSGTGNATLNGFILDPDATTNGTNGVSCEGERRLGPKTQCDSECAGIQRCSS